MPKIISERREMIQLCHINCSSPVILRHTGRSFHIWISVSLSPKFGLRPKISQRVKFFSFGLVICLVSAISLSEIAETKHRTERSLNPKLINSPVDFAGIKLVNRLYPFHTYAVQAAVLCGTTVTFRACSRKFFRKNPSESCETYGNREDRKGTVLTASKT